MKKILLIPVLLSFFVLPAVVLAQEPPEDIPDIVQTPEDIIRIIERVAGWLFAILLAVALVFILIAAYQFLTSGGDPVRVQNARQNLMYALIGIAVAFLARGLVMLVRFVLGVPAP
jgi:hypothetical protein